MSAMDKVVSNSDNRDSSFELLRIMAMLLIVAGHFSVHGGFNYSSNMIFFNRLWIQLISISGNIGVNIYVLISGYFLISSENTKTSKILRLLLQTFSYSILCFIIFLLIGNRTLSMKELIKVFFPITYSEYWFASTYFMVYLLHPYINMFISKIKNEIFIKMLLVLTICWSIIPTFLASSFQSNSLSWFIYLYILGAYYRLYGDRINISLKNCLIWVSVIMVFAFASIFTFDILGLQWPIFAKYATIFLNRQKLPAFLVAIVFLGGAKSLKPYHNKTVNAIASASFGVYLIHDNPYIREFLWKTVFKNALYADASYLIPYNLMIAFLVYCSCTMIELIRINLIEKKYMFIINKCASRIDKKIDEYFYRYYSKYIGK